MTTIVMLCSTLRFVCWMWEPRSERKKWQHCFQDVDMMVFAVNVAECHSHLLEDENVTLMQENARLFAYLCESRWFQAAKIFVMGTHFDCLVRLWEMPRFRETIVRTLQVPEEALVSPHDYACWLISYVIGKPQRAEIRSRIVVMPAISTFAPTEL